MTYYLQLRATAKLQPALLALKIYTIKAIIKFSAQADAYPRRSICCLINFHNNTVVTVITASKTEIGAKIILPPTNSTDGGELQTCVTLRSIAQPSIPEVYSKVIQKKMESGWSKLEAELGEERSWKLQRPARAPLLIAGPQGI